METPEDKQKLEELEKKLQTLLALNHELEIQNKVLSLKLWKVKQVEKDRVEKEKLRQSQSQIESVPECPPEQSKSNSKPKPTPRKQRTNDVQGTTTISKKITTLETTGVIAVIPEGDVDLGDSQELTSTSSPPEDSTVNPFIIEEVVHALMKQMTPKDLLNSRFVSKLWNKEACKVIQEKLTLKLPCHRYGQINTFLEVIEKSFPKFRKFELELQMFAGWGKSRVNEVNIFKTYGRHLLNVTFHFPLTSITQERLQTFEYFRDGIVSTGCLDDITYLRLDNFPCILLHSRNVVTFNGIRKNMPNVTTLYIGLTCGNCTNSHFAIRGFEGMFRLFPKLKNFHWNSLDYRRLSNRDGFANILEALFRVNNQNLEGLYIYNPTQDVLLATLANSGLKLKKLYVKELKSFEVRFLSPSIGRTEIIPKMDRFGKHGIKSEVVKKKLEAAILDCGGEVYCTKLLGIFISTLRHLRNKD